MINIDRSMVVVGASSSRPRRATVPFWPRTAWNVSCDSYTHRGLVVVVGGGWWWWVVVVVVVVVVSSLQ
jgi:hypothetical protein